jgi:NAD+ synthase
MSLNAKPFSSHVLELDCAAETEKIVSRMRAIVKQFRRRGLIVALSGGIDSSVTAALCVRAVGKDKVFGLHMPEQDSAEETLTLSQAISSHYGFDSAVEDITHILEAVGCYRRRDDAIRAVIPAYGPGWKNKIVLPNVVENKGYNFFSVVAQAPDGEMMKARLPLEAYLGILSASNFKQRIRKMLEYYHADRLNYCTTGTPNRLEYDQGFFVKLGDSAADIKPIAHLYKTQVYKLAEYLDVPAEIRKRPPTTDTYSLPQGQDEFYFSLPYDKMDLCLWGLNHGVPAAEVAPAAGITAEQAERVYKDIETKRTTTQYLHTPPVLVEKVPEVKLPEFKLP